MRTCYSNAGIVYCKNKLSEASKFDQLSTPKCEGLERRQKNAEADARQDSVNLASILCNVNRGTKYMRLIFVSQDVQGTSQQTAG
jgi:hypothetical protein